MLTLAGKFFTSLPPPSINNVETSLHDQWSSFLSGGFKVTPFDEEIILFDFVEEQDLKKVLKEGPWNVDGVILVLKEYPLGTSLSNIDFSVACFWVKVEGLLLFHYTRQEFVKIAKRLSDKPLICEYINWSQRYFGVRVEVDLRKPLEAGFFIGDQREPHFVKFRYEKLGNFCEACGKIDHIDCGKTPKERALTSEFKTKTYGPWLRCCFTCSVSSAPARFECNFLEKPIGETTDKGEAELLVEFKIVVEYRSEHEWSGKTLTYTVPEKDERHCFRLPLSLLSETTPNYAEVYEVLSSEIQEIASLVGLRSCEKDGVIGSFIDYLVENTNKWSHCRRRFVPLTANITKQIMIPMVEYEKVLQERRDDELRGKINVKISELIKTRVERNENLLSVSQWMESIKEALREIGVTLVESELEQRAIEASNEAIEMELSWRKGPKPADREIVEELETVNVLGHEMSLCTICKEDMFIGEEATRMPCSHLFHKQCLQGWLKTANSCPLCRFQLPTSNV
ncbi:unnamed protein product [Arabis nemorensis]|uniref:RING-type domain-containing protein n=1 Tax=Arabis nemorensis TaxID=586526 RepID=A0A565BCE1_9BRAS|nr:unnamed protein product [Arabis nemorensis]